MKEIQGYQNIFNNEMTPMYDELTGEVFVICNSCDGKASETVIDKEHYYQCDCKPNTYSYNDSFLDVIKLSI